MRNNKIYVMHSNSKIESLYTLFPLIISKYSELIKFVNIDSKEAKTAEGECVILVRVFKGNKSFSEEDQRKRNYIQDFRRRFNRVVMLDDGAGSDSLHFEYMDLVDLYYKGKLLKDRSNYLKQTYGRQIFTDYYNQKFGIVDEKEKLRELPNDPSILKKLRVSWNLGYGMYPLPNENTMRIARTATTLSLSKALSPWYKYCYKKMTNKLSRPINYDSKLRCVHARFGYKSLPNTIAYQRKIFVEKCSKNENVIIGKIKQGAYNTEISKAGAILSPFGWGEICFRDFEAIYNGSLLIKPNMDHIETWPDLYKESKTYISIDWDGNDLEETIDRATKDIKAYSPIIENAKDEYHQSLLQIDNKVLEFLEEATGTKIN
jgi:hypothetical protein